MADVIVPRVAEGSVPIIDGLGVTIDASDAITGEWTAAVQSDSSGAPLMIDNLIIDIDADGDGDGDADGDDGSPYRRWAAMHDGTYLYVVVIVDDDGARYRDSDNQLTDDDSLELFLDGDNSKTDSYDANDFHRIIPVQLAGRDKQSASSGDVAGPNSTYSPLLVDFATGPGVGPSGIRRPRYERDVYELRIHLGSAGIDIDKPFGFDVQINDDDDGNERDSKWAWKLTSSDSQANADTVSNPSLMGTLVLE
jgi:hypothetical protein